MILILVYEVADHDGVFQDESDVPVTAWEDEDGNVTFTDDQGLTGG